MLAECFGAPHGGSGLGSLGHVTVDGARCGFCAPPNWHPGVQWQRCSLRLQFQNHSCPASPGCLTVWCILQVRSACVLVGTLRWFQGSHGLLLLLFSIDHYYLVLWWSSLYSKWYWLSIYGSDLKYLLKIFKWKKGELTWKKIVREIRVWKE